MKWTNEEIIELRKKYLYYLKHHKEAESYFRRDWDLIRFKAYHLGITSIKVNKDCSMFLGCHIAERVLIYVFKDVQKMLSNNKGFDFICNKGKKIDVKSCCLDLKRNNYNFAIGRNKITDYFLLIGFDDRTNLNPQHIWLIKSDELFNYYGRYNKKLESNKVIKRLNGFESLRIVNTIDSLYSYDLTDFSKYELTDKLKETIECCNKLKGEDK